MPFSRELRPVHATMKDICNSIGMTCERADDIYSQRPIFTAILDSIISSEIIIADLTGKNPNVFYETGIAHSVREPQSVILIAQNLEDVPFDLRHLPIVLYKLDNLQKFEVEIEKRILHSRAATRGMNFAINYLFPLNFQPHDVKSFIDYANELSNTFFFLLAECLGRVQEVNDETLSEKDIEDIFMTIHMASEANNSRWKRICDYLKLEILCSKNQFESMRERCLSHLHKTSINQCYIKNRDEDFFAAELCFKLINRDLSKTNAINWLLSYLHNPRMGNIDVVRYRIETFIVEANDSDLNSSLLALLSSDSPHIRENIADITGQKSIKSAGKFLANALIVESNPYAARSIITALARQNAVEGVPIIVEWVGRHVDKWWEEPISVTIRRVSEEAVKKLAPDSDYMRMIQTYLSSGKSEKRE